jgi:hypothetical protein
MTKFRRYFFLLVQLRPVFRPLKVYYHVRSRYSDSIACCVEENDELTTPVRALEELCYWLDIAKVVLIPRTFSKSRLHPDGGSDKRKPKRQKERRPSLKSSQGMPKAENQAQ